MNQFNYSQIKVIDHQNLDGNDSISKMIQTEMKTNQGKLVRVKKVHNDFWSGPYYGIEYESRQILSVNFDELILSKVVIVPDGDDYFFYSMRSPIYNAFGSTILFKLV
jgi:hypothetical protein